MLNLITVAVLTAAGNGDVYATWIHDDPDNRIAIRIEADGQCTIESTRKFNGKVFSSPCAYTVAGSSVVIRAPGEGGAKEFSLTLDARTDEMTMGGTDGAMRFYRTRLDRR